LIGFNEIWPLENNNKLVYLQNQVVSRGKEVSKDLHNWVNKNAPTEVTFVFNKLEGVINLMLAYKNDFAMLPQV
jgi:hypothetical protein